VLTLKTIAVKGAPCVCSSAGATEVTAIIISPFDHYFHLPDKEIPQSQRSPSCGSTFFIKLINHHNGNIMAAVTELP